MSGVITGGWGFVTAAYVITTVVLVGYTVSLLLRARWKGRSSE